MNRVDYNFEHCLFIVTPLCNLRCRMCWMWKEKRQYLSDREILETLKYLKLLNVKDLVISGGEPLLSISLLEKILLNYSSQFNIYIVSNGILFNQKNSIRLLKAGAKSFIISLDGVEESNDKVRGEGSYKKVIKNIKNLINLRKTKFNGLILTVNTVINRFNFASLIPFIQQMYSLGIDRVEFQPIHIKEGGFNIQNKNRKLMKELMPSSKDIPRLVKEVNAIINFKRKYDRFIGNSFTHLELIKDYFASNNFNNQFICKVYKKALTIDWKGNIHYCLYTPSIGEIKELINPQKIFSSSRSQKVIVKIKKCKEKCLLFCNQPQLEDEITK